MAIITPVIGHEAIIAIGDGATPTEVFTASASINTTRGISFSTETESDELIDTADQSAIALVVRRARAKDSKIDGAGMVSKTDVKTWADWAVAGTAKNIKVTFGNMLATGSYILTGFQLTGERKKTVEFQCTLEQAGAVTITTAP